MILATAYSEDGDRRVNLEEFVEHADRLGLVVDRKEAKVIFSSTLKSLHLLILFICLQAVFQQADRNGGGEILFDEFCRYIIQRKMPLG